MIGETKKTETFVAALPFGHCAYSEAVSSQCKEDLIKGCKNTIQYFEGVPGSIIPEIIRKQMSYKATVTSLSLMMILSPLLKIAAVRSILPVYVPNKALVENTVKPLYRSVYFNMRMVFFSLDEFNIAIIFPCLISMKG